MEALEGIHEVDSVYDAGLELLQLDIPEVLGHCSLACYFVEDCYDGPYLFGCAYVLRPVQYLFDASLAQVLRDVSGVHLSQFAEIQPSVYFLPPLEEVILLILHLPLLFLLLLFFLRLSLRCLCLGLIPLPEQVANNPISHPAQPNNFSSPGCQSIDEHNYILNILVIFPPIPLYFNHDLRPLSGRAARHPAVYHRGLQQGGPAEGKREQAEVGTPKAD